MSRAEMFKLISIVAGKYIPSDHPELFKLLNWTVKHLEWRKQDLENLRKHEATIRELQAEVARLKKKLPKPVEDDSHIVDPDPAY